MRDVLRRIGLTLAVLLALETSLQLVFFAVEGRWAMDGPGYRVTHLVETDDARGYTYRPGFRDPEQGMTFDSLGFRIDPSRPPPRRGSRVVVALGDSVPFGHGRPDSVSYPAQLDAALAARGSPFRVVNAGVQSYNLRQSIEHFRRDVLPNYQPVVVTLQAANDVGLVLQYGSRWTPERTWAPDAGGTLAQILSRSALVHYVATPLRALVPAGREAPVDRMVAHERRLLASFLRECAARHIAVVLLPIDPFYYRDVARNARLSRWADWRSRSQGWERVFDAYNEAMRDVASRNGAYFLDTRDVLDRHDREALYIDDIHYSERGNALVAEAILAFMDEHALLPDR